MKSLISNMMVLVTCFWSFALWANYDRLQLNDAESAFCHAPIVVEGKVLSIKSEPSHYTIGASSSYSYKLKFLVENVLKGDPKYKNKEITIATYFQPGFFDVYNKHPRFMTALIEIDENNLAIPLQYNLVQFERSSLRQELLNGNTDCSGFHVIPLDELIGFDKIAVNKSELIIEGFFFEERIFDAKFSFRNFFQLPFHTIKSYRLDKFQVLKVIKGNTKLEGTSINFVHPNYQMHGQLSSCNFIGAGGVFLLGTENLPVLNSKTDPLYSGPDGYNFCDSKNYLFEAEHSPAFKIFLKNTNSATQTGTASVTNNKE